MVICVYFSRIETPLRHNGSRRILLSTKIKEHFVTSPDWHNKMFRDVQACPKDHSCDVAIDRVDLETLERFPISHENFLLRLVENPIGLLTRNINDLILAINHLNEELNAWHDLFSLPVADQAHLAKDIPRVYLQLIP